MKNFNPSTSGISDLLVSTFDTIRNPILIRDESLNTAQCNEAFCTLVGMDKERILGRLVTPLCPPPLSTAISETDMELLDRGGKQASRKFVLETGGRLRVFMLEADTITDGSGVVRGISGIIHELTAIVKAEDKVSRFMRLKDAILAINSTILGIPDTDQLFDLLLKKVLDAVDHATVGCVLLVSEGQMLRIAASRGYPLNEISDFRVRMEDTFQWKKSMGNLDETLIINDLQEFMSAFGIPKDILKDADGFVIKSTMSTPLIVNGEFLGLINLDSRYNNVFDETDRILVEYVRLQVPIVIGMFRAHEQVRKLVIEKDLILKEVHHRIKNNMSTIDSVLHLHSMTLGDPAARCALEDAASRVKSMMVLYDTLYLSDDFNNTQAAGFLPALVDQILTTFPHEASITVEKHVEPFAIGTKNAQALGIIVNEIITNIMKYAFRGRTVGRISLTATKSDSRVRIEIGDDGIGMPDTVEIGKPAGFGLMLVESLTAQMNGSVRIESNHGTKFMIEFPS